MNKLTHIDKSNKPRMVDIGGKKITSRSAHARTYIILPKELMSLFSDGEIKTPKGPVFNTAIVAGVMAAKKTHEFIPFCHPIGFENCDISIELDDKKLVIDCICKIKSRTGVEMEALTGVSMAALVVYDMCKALSHDITIGPTQLISKHGGKKDFNRDE